MFGPVAAGDFIRRGVMGIQNRDWYKSNAGGGWGSDWGLYSLTPVVKYIIIANVVVFLLQCFFLREVRVSRQEMIRQYDPNLNKLLEKYKDDPEKLQELRKKYPQIDAILKAEEYDELVESTQKVSVVTEWCELDTKKVIYNGQVWRLLTHAFCHDWRGGIWHIFFNMLILYWFGCTIEAMYGAREFLLFYLTAALIAA